MIYTSSRSAATAGYLWPILLRKDRACVRCLEEVRDEMNFRLVGYVVMPNHVHLLMSEPPGATPSQALHRLKLGFSRKIRKRKRLDVGQLRWPFPEHEQPLRSFWQARFYDFNVHSRGKLTEKLNYMHANPVIRGLVQHPKDWPWSSWSFYRKNQPGLIRIDAEWEKSTPRPRF